MTFFAIEAVMSEQTVITLNDFIFYSLSNLLTVPLHDLLNMFHEHIML